jgi:beta-lactamase regulating signal transducer with metallopeptidase domain/Mg-chelatase subunit ChlD
MTIDLVSQLVSAAIRAFGLGLAAFAGLLLLRVRSSAARHATWTVVLVGMLVQIPLEIVAPTVPLKVLPTVPARIQPRVMESARISKSAPTPASASHPRIEQKEKWISSSSTLTGVYLVVSILLFARMALGSWGLRRILRDAKPIPNLSPGIFESVSIRIPGSVGYFRARILLPPAWRDWDAVKLRAVLAHEQAHVRRGDWLIRVASHVNVCIFWFHPLAWWLERELTRLAEEACDDAALFELEDREQYAVTLVEIAHAAAADGGVLNWGVVSMAKESNVIRRVNRILNRRFSIPKPFGRLAWVTLFACSLPVIYLSAAVKLVSENRDSTVLEHAVVPARPAKEAPAALWKPKPAGLVAQAAPNQGLRPAPLTPSRRLDPPTSMCILIDNSGSMRDKRARVEAVALALVRASNPHDEVCIVNFNDEAFIDRSFTSDIKKMEGALTRIDSRGGSAMRDAVRMLIDYIQQKAQNGRRVLVVVTDGNDTSSAVSQEQLLGKVKDSGVLVYCIGLLNEDDPDHAGAAKLALEQLAEASGGLDYYPKDLADLESITSEIAHEVRKQ